MLAVKKEILLLLLCFISIYSFSQDTFKKGYFINNEGEKIEGLIKDLDWRFNPNDIIYKQSENEVEKFINISEIKSFEIFNSSLYEKASVKIDRSSSYLNNLSEKRAPDYAEETLFLKVLIKGKATLYSYEDQNLIRYFYAIDSNTPEQLIYKEYFSNKTTVKKNTDFRIQLFKYVKSAELTYKNINKVDYNKKDLATIFTNFNKENNSSYQDLYEKEKIKVENKDLFNLTLKTGINQSNIQLNNDNYGHHISNVNLEKSYALKFSIETEFFLPFNNNKWSFIIEPTYQSSNSKTSHFYSATPNYTIDDVTSEITVDYTSIEIPFGIRRAHYITKNSKLFFNIFGVFDKSIQNSYINIKSQYTNNPNYNEQKLKIKTNSLSFAVGLGYKYLYKYSIELRYYNPINLLKTYQQWGAKQQAISLFFGYTIF